MKTFFGLLTALGLTACGPTPENDPVYLALKANPPTSIPAHHLKKLRGGRASCEVFEEATARQYMTCWWPSGAPPSLAHYSYYGAGLTRPRPENLRAPGGTPVTTIPMT